MLSIRIGEIDDGARAAVRERLSEIQPGMGQDEAVSGPVLARLTAWLTDGTERAYTNWAAATTAALRSCGVDSLLYRTAQDEAAMHALAETEARRAQYLRWSQDLGVMFGNCGRTAEYVRVWMAERYGATVQDDGGETFAPGAAAGLTAWLTTRPAAGSVHLLDCLWRNLHNFLVELHPDGTAYLVQGYQGAYSALWWMTDAVVDLVSGRRVADREAIRAASGGGRPIDLTALGGALTTFVNDRSRDHWRALPFDPVQTPPVTEEGNELICRRYTVTNPTTVYGSVGGVAPQSLARRTLLTTRPPG